MQLQSFPSFEFFHKSESKDIKYFEIKGADHSYKDPKTGEPKFQDEAIKVLASL